MTANNNNTIEGGCVKAVASKTGHQWFGTVPPAGPDHHHWWASWHDLCSSAAKSVGTAATISPPATPSSPSMPMLLQQPPSLHRHSPHEEQPLDFSVGTMSKYKESPIKSQGHKMMQQNGGHHIARHHRNNNKHNQEEALSRSYHQQQQQVSSSSSSEDEGVGPPSPSAAESPGPLRGDGESTPLVGCPHVHRNGYSPSSAPAVSPFASSTISVVDVNCLFSIRNVASFSTSFWTDRH